MQRCPRCQENLLLSGVCERCRDDAALWRANQREEYRRHEEAAAIRREEGYRQAEDRRRINAAAKERQRREKVSDLVAQGHSQREAELRVEQLEEFIKRAEQEYERFHYEEQRRKAELKALSLARHIQTQSIFAVVTYPIHNVFKRGLIGLKPPPEIGLISCPRCGENIRLPSLDQLYAAGDESLWPLTPHAESCILSPPSPTSTPERSPRRQKDDPDIPPPRPSQLERIFFGPGHSRNTSAPTEEQKRAIASSATAEGLINASFSFLLAGLGENLTHLEDAIVDALGRPNHEWQGVLVLKYANANTASSLARSYAKAVDLPLVILDHRDGGVNSKYAVDADSVLRCLRRDLAATRTPLVDTGANAYFAPPCVVWYGTKGEFAADLDCEVMKASDSSTIDVRRVTWILSTADSGLELVTHPKQVVWIDLMSNMVPYGPEVRSDLPDDAQWYVWCPGMPQADGPLTINDMLRRIEVDELSDDSLCWSPEFKEYGFRYLSVVRDTHWFKAKAEALSSATACRKPQATVHLRKVARKVIKRGGTKKAADTRVRRKKKGGT